MGALLDQFEASQAERSNALGLLRAASDPEGTKARIEELAVATQAHEQAAEAASKAQAAAEAAQAAADAAIAEANRKEAWVADQQNRIKMDGQNIAEHHNEIARRQRDLAAIGDRLAERERQVTAFVEQARRWVASMDEAAKV